MKVKELIEKLKEFPEDIEVVTDSSENRGGIIVHKTISDVDGIEKVIVY